MKFVRFKHAERVFLGVLSKDEKHVLKLDDLLNEEVSSEMNDFIKNHSSEDIETIKEGIHIKSGTQIEIDLKEVELLVPIRHPLHDILCVGLNYVRHLEEFKKGMNEGAQEKETVYFSKRAAYIAGDKEQIKGRFDLDPKLDYEAELGLVLAKGGSQIKMHNAMEHVFGFFVFNDLTARGLQKAHKQWLIGKSVDGYCAMGSYILHRSAVKDIHWDISTFVNGELRQHSNTKFLMKDVPCIISELSEAMTLFAGDMIVTGTPEGVGMGMQPPCYLKPLDVVCCEIEGLGSLTNEII